MDATYYTIIRTIGEADNIIQCNSHCTEKTNFSLFCGFKMALLQHEHTQTFIQKSAVANIRYFTCLLYCAVILFYVLHPQCEGSLKFKPHKAFCVFASLLTAQSCQCH